MTRQKLKMFSFEVKTISTSKWAASVWSSGTGSLQYGWTPTWSTALRAAATPSATFLSPARSSRWRTWSAGPWPGVPHWRGERAERQRVSLTGGGWTSARQTSVTASLGLPALKQSLEMKQGQCLAARWCWRWCLLRRHRDQTSPGLPTISRRSFLLVQSGVIVSMSNNDLQRNTAQYSSCWDVWEREWEISWLAAWLGASPARARPHLCYVFTAGS